MAAKRAFPTSHARVLLSSAHDPAARLRDIAASPGITEHSAHAIVTDLVPLENSIGWLTSTLADRLDTVMAGSAGAAQDLLRG